MAARILVAVLLSLAGAPVAAETYLEHIKRLGDELLALQRQITEGEERKNKLTAFRDALPGELDRDKGSVTSLCESERLGLRVLNEVLNGPLAQVQTTEVKYARTVVTYELHMNFRLAVLAGPGPEYDPTTGTVDFGPSLDDFDALSPADWSALTGDVGWGEGCMFSGKYDEESLGCAKGGRMLLFLFKIWAPVLETLGLHGEAAGLLLASVIGQYAFNELCGFSQDE